ncbi:hypothetical protein GUJ93_ZPchr0009g1353 [Zizania palustris]|uniref:Uncharacterized protein n=1 Tax=Zizania palustris TaxID=103762 RepID=A0A8J5V7A5_ZIZPA|nr:hypothetical protein GUJ93_ZPchr0009g1353 [Zizania palustris]
MHACTEWEEAVARGRRCRRQRPRRRGSREAAPCSQPSRKQSSPPALLLLLLASQHASIVAWNGHDDYPCSSGTPAPPFLGRLPEASMAPASCVLSLPSPVLSLRPMLEETLAPPLAHGEQQDSRWLQTLSDPELDLLITLKDLATSGQASRACAHLYHLRTLRVLGIALLENIKQRLGETSVNVDPNVFDRLALLSDPDVNLPCIGSDSESEPVGSKPSEDRPTPMGVMESESTQSIQMHGSAMKKVKREENWESI